MPKTKISEFSATPANNTDIDSINIAEGCAPSGINDAIRELMAQLKDFQTGAVGDSFNGPVGTSTAAAGAFTTLSASSTLGVTGVATLGAGAILNTPASVTLTNATGLPISTGVSGLGTGVATFLATPSSANLAAALTDETGSGANVFATSPTLVTPILGTPTSATLTNATGLPLTTGVTGTLPTANGGTNLTSFTSGGVVYASSSSALATGSALTFNGTSLGVGSSSYGDAGSITAAIGVPGTTAGGLQLWASPTQEHYIQWGDSTSGSATYAGAISYSHASNFMRFWTGSTERMRITSAGDVGIGTTSPSTKLTVYDATTPQVTFNNGTSTFIVGNNAGGNNKILYGTGAYPMIFYTDAIERARIDSSGNLLVGRTTTANTTVGSGLYADGIIASCQSGSTNGNTAYDLYSTGASAYRFYVGMGGTIYATSTTITAISDQRLKENIRDLDEGLATVMALKPRKFDWKEGKGQDIKNARGFIAQEFETVLPDMIETWRDPAPEGEEAYKAINANLIPTLVKAIQELKAEFDAYKASHP